MTLGAPRLASASQGVVIRGGGIAANTCAHLLRRGGLPVSRTSASRRPVPAILLSDTALGLLRDVFDRPDLFAGRPRIDRRIVAWGDAAPVTLPHGAVVVSEADLDAALAGAKVEDGAEGAVADLTLYAEPPFPAGEVQAFGERTGAAAPVRLADPGDATTCWIESVATGWLFLIPAGAAQGWLLSVGGGLEDVLTQSRHVAARIAECGVPSGTFPTGPRLLGALQGPGWLACGSAAIGFDPICGDGTAQAVREAILASAVLAAIAEGGDAGALRLHYQSMILAAMRRHLRLCGQFYASGGQGLWWRTQLADLVAGFDVCTARLARMPEPRFELHGERLVARGAAA